MILLHVSKHFLGKKYKLNNFFIFYYILAYLLSFSYINTLQVVYCS